MQCNIEGVRNADLLPKEAEKLNAISKLPAPSPSEHNTVICSSYYLASIEMSDDFDNDLLILIRGLIPGNNYLSCCQVLKFIDLQIEKKK